MSTKHQNGTTAVLDDPTAGRLATISPLEDDDDGDSLDEIDQIIESNSAVMLDEQEQVESSVPTFESVFAADPLAARYKAFGDEAREQFDSPDLAADRVRLGAMGYDIMCEEMKLRPAAYNRADVVKKMEMSFALCGVPASVKVQDIIRVFWVVKLDQSVPGNAGEPRTFVGSTADPAWYGGNISYESLYVLAGLINRVSGKSELDLFEYDPGLESFSRLCIKRLRRGELSKRTLTALVKHQREAIEKERERLANQNLSAAQMKALDEAKLAAKQEADTARLRNMMATALDHAIKVCGKDKDEFRDFLVNSSFIPPVPHPTAKEFARTMTPGDAKGLVQELMTLYVTDPSRAKVLSSLVHACNDAVKQMRSAHESENGQAKTKVA